MTLRRSFDKTPPSAGATADRQDEPARRRFGYHVSVAGGLSTAIAEAKALTCNTIQIFLGPPHTWQLSNFTAEETSLFKKERARLKLDPVIVHAAYLPNLASSSDALWNISTHYLINLGKKAAALGLSGVDFHLGSNPSRKEGIKRVIAALRKMEEETPKDAVYLLETDAGPGNHVGDTFEEIKELLAGVRDPRRFGVTLDTCHVFAAGYDIRTEEAVDEMVKQFEKTVKLSFLKVIHANDSKGELGSHLDRHEHIGEGKIGTEGFRALVNHPQLKGVPFILETPKTNSREEDLKNIKKLRELSEGGRD